jgi:hypothetical protein
MKYEVLKRQMDIDRQFKIQLESDKKVEKSLKFTKLPPNTIKNEKITDRLKEHSLQCKKCSNFYLPSQNQSTSCLVHLRAFVLTCPQACKKPGFSVSCSSHR